MWRIAIGLPLIVFFVFLPIFLAGYLVSRLVLKLSVLASLGLSLLLDCLVLLSLFLNLIPRHHTVHLRHFTPFGLGLRMESLGSGLSHIFILLIVALLLVIGILFLVRIVRKWMGKDLTDAERKSGFEGLKAWFSVGNILWGILIVIFGSIVGAGFWNSVFVVLFLLGIYPLLNTLKSTGTKEQKSVQGESLERTASEETDKILKMLEQGKITAEEASDLLNALAQTQRLSSSSPVPLSPSRRFILIGAAIVLLGSVFPWFKVDLGKEMNNISMQFSGMTEEPVQIPMPKVSEKSMVSVQDAYDIKNGLGLLIVLLALGVAALPYLNLRMDRQTIQTVSFCALGLGSLVILHLLFSSYRFVSVGFVIVIVGYGLELAGLFQEKKTPWFA